MSDAVAGPLGDDRPLEHSRQIVVIGTRAQQRLEVELLDGKEAVAELAVRGEPDSSAPLAKRSNSLSSANSKP